MRLGFIEPGKPVQNLSRASTGAFVTRSKNGLYGSNEAALVRLSNVSISIGSTLAVMRVKRLPAGGITTTANIRIRHWATKALSNSWQPPCRALNRLKHRCSLQLLNRTRSSSPKNPSLQLAEGTSVRGTARADSSG